MSSKLSQRTQSLISRFAKQDIRALAQAISLVEDGEGEAAELLSALSSRKGNARIIGITGPPGAGKSTLTAQFARRLLDRGETVGMLLIDPSSPFTGGAILGDRIRMTDLSGRSGLYIRSLGSRGSLGGLSAVTAQAIELLDFFGFENVIVETVGTGQAETDIVETVDTVVVLAVPGMGDDIQAMKAGIMEIADVFVVNKADREGADRTARQIGAALELGKREGRPVPPVILTVAIKGEGLPELLEAVDQHTAHLRDSGELHERRRRRSRRELTNILGALFLRDFEDCFGETLAEEIRRVVEGEGAVYAAAKALFTKYREERMGGNAK
ncbi:MAG TPA: methylmalonyl Co-A mutase-associated GTPase MeaB [Bacillota bacterium]|nr:methylmalonyl Co-A mutase-associated GTPase MeaB [Bacillota bacterium]